MRNTCHNSIISDGTRSYHNSIYSSFDKATSSIVVIGMFINSLSWLSYSTVRTCIVAIKSMKMICSKDLRRNNRY